MQCRLCGAPSTLIAKDHHGYQEGNTFDIYECKQCNTSFVLPVDFTTEIYQAIYKNAEFVPGYNRYYYYRKQAKASKDALKFLADAESMYWAVQEVLHNFKGKNILEVGSGFGYLTYAIHQKGYDIRGVDISATAVAEATNTFGALYECADVFDFYKNHLEEYDLIILTEVIEHLEHPVAFMECLYKMLKKGGKIFVTTPNKSVSSLKDPWMSDLPPVHLWWFSEQSAAYIAKQLNCTVSLVDFTKFNRNNFIKPRYKIFNDYGHIPPRLDSAGAVIDPAPWNGDQIGPIKALAQKIVTRIMTTRLLDPLLARPARPIEKSDTLAFLLEPIG